MSTKIIREQTVGMSDKEIWDLLFRSIDDLTARITDLKYEVERWRSK